MLMVYAFLLLLRPIDALQHAVGRQWHDVRRRLCPSVTNISWLNGISYGDVFYTNN